MSEQIIYVRVVNHWTTPISGSVTHIAPAAPSATISFHNLPVGASSQELAVVTGGNGLDHWSYLMQDASHHAWSGELQCDIDPADDGGRVECVFDAAESELRIVRPAASACVQQLQGYGGFMRVRNSFDHPISGWVMHQTTDFGTAPVSFRDLKPGDETEIVAFASGASSMDRWYYEIELDGAAYRGVHKCSFGPEYRGRMAILDFCVPREETLAIRTIMPDFDSCFTRLARRSEETVAAM
jgi:hypothetical protein